MADFGFYIRCYKCFEDLWIDGDLVSGRNDWSPKGALPTEVKAPEGVVKKFADKHRGCLVGNIQAMSPIFQFRWR